MSQTFFSKLDVPEKNNRLNQLANSKGIVTVWIKGQKEKYTFSAMKFDKERQELALEAQADHFSNGANVLCSFDTRGMTFFSQVVFRKGTDSFSTLHFLGDLFKSERRSSFRLLTYPLYEVWAQFDMGEKYEGSNVIDMNKLTNQTKLFHSFVKLVEGDGGKSENLTKIKIRIQDISHTGMSIHVGEMEVNYFTKGKSYKNVTINFIDEEIEIPEVLVVYVVDYISNDKNIKRYKVGCNFSNLPANIDDLLGRKINKLLRENDFNKEFENFIK